MDAEELRDRQRKRVKHRYYQTIHSLSHSRELVQQLTAQHLRLLKQQHEASTAASGSRQRALRQYTEVTMVADELRQEKLKLMELLEKRERLQDRLMTLLDESSGTRVSSSSAIHVLL